MDGANCQTLTRMHIAFTLVTAQVLGSIATILARAIAPDNIGPGDVFPDFSSYTPGDTLEVFQKPWFYIGLFSQILICVGYFLFFRKVDYLEYIADNRNNWRNRKLKPMFRADLLSVVFCCGGIGMVACLKAY